MKIVIINHTFQIPRFYKRWKLLAEAHKDWEVYLIAPSKFKWDTNHSLIFGGNVQATGLELNEGNFHICAVRVKDMKIGWISKEMCRVLVAIKPNIIYHIGGHTQLSLIQCIKLVQKKLPATKLMAFSMRGPAMNIRLPKLASIKQLPAWILSYASYLLRKHNLRYFNKGCDAVLCHYPDAIECFKKEGYNGPIYMSTQVGVDPDIYHPSEEYRTEIRELLGLGNSYVFGCAIRFLPMKGLSEIIEAMPQQGDWKLLVMGTGDKAFEENAKQRLQERGIANKVIFTGYIEWDLIAKYWNAIDCAIHVPRTTEKWEETFSLSIVQAMATGKPVIGNTSGSVPYQIGPNGLIVKEGDIPALTKKIVWAMEHPQEAKEIGEKMKKYAIDSFSIGHLNKQFAAIVEDVVNNKLSEGLTDMTRFSQIIN